MTRPYALEILDGTFHVTSRGNAKRVVFDDDMDRKAFLLELSYAVRRHSWIVLAYCLMGNHFHLLVRTPDANLAEGMRDLKSQYARSFNRRRGIDGSVFKARFWRQLVQEDDYLLAASVYIVQNPVRTGKVTHPGEWPWSSFAATVSGTPGLVNPGPILGLLDDDPATARRMFSELAHGVNGLPSFDPSLPIVGDETFLRTHSPSERPGRNVAKLAWEQARPTLDELAVGLERDALIVEARLTHRYTLVEIAAHLGCSDQTVRRRLRVSGVGTRQV